MQARAQKECEESEKECVRACVDAFAWSRVRNTVERATNGRARVQAVAGLLKVEAEDIRNAMCNRLITAGTDVMVKPETAEKASQARDALGKVLYSKLFDYIVTCVNTALRLKSETVTMQVSVLDIFGFEVFQRNNFEQFCINYANEKLQLHFNHFNFMLERALYAREGIELVESDFVDNSACVELIENKGWGIQAHTHITHITHITHHT